MKKTALMLAIMVAFAAPSFAGKDDYLGMPINKENCSHFVTAYLERLEMHRERHEQETGEHHCDVSDTVKLYEAIKKCVEKGHLTERMVSKLPPLPEYLR